MNFLIISLARCGSTSLQKSISNHYNLKIVFEPYAAWGLQRRKYSFENVVVKTILHQIDNKEFRLGNLLESHFEKCFNFYLNLSNLSSILLIFLSLPKSSLNIADGFQGSVSS